MERVPREGQTQSVETAALRDGSWEVESWNLVLKAHILWVKGALTDALLIVQHWDERALPCDVETMA